MNISTKAKIYLASLINYPIIFIVNKIFGTSTRRVKRKGILWELDLTEGIDFSIFLFGLFEKETSDAIRRLVGNNSVVIDIGANIGAHTLPMAKLVGKKGKVYAIEPTNYAYSKLKNNLLFNKNLDEKVQADHIILTNNDDKARVKGLYSSWPLSVKTKKDQRHSVHQGILMSISGAKEKTLDDYVAINNIVLLDLIKLDVDGNELDVLGGAKGTLKRFKPIIIMELAPDQYNNKNDFLEVVDMLSSMGYKYYSLNEMLQYPSKPQELIENIPTNGSINVVARVVK
jgi:FkbM family methyltransferase